jgi:virulence-associated protein VapD
MFVIAYDLVTAEAKRHHPRGSRQAYADIETTLLTYGFERAQWSVFTARDENLENLIRAVLALKALPWFGPSIKNIRAFRMEPGTDLTAIFADTVRTDPTESPRQD